MNDFFVGSTQQTLVALTLFGVLQLVHILPSFNKHNQHSGWYPNNFVKKIDHQYIMQVHINYRKEVWPCKHDYPAYNI